MTGKRNVADRAKFDPKSAEPALAPLTMIDLMKHRADLEERIEQAETAWMEAMRA